MNIGQVCIKIAGRDAGQPCVIIKQVDQNTVLIDGNTRRRKCNVKHLEPIDKIVSIDEDAGHADVVRALKNIGIVVAEKKKRTKTTAKKEKPKRSHKTRNKTAAPEAKEKKAVKKPKKEKPVKKEATPKTNE